jgi:hypothetical protein
MEELKRKEEEFGVKAKEQAAVEKERRRKEAE